eukprot:5558787-Prymnesium_polylepis.1
MSVRVCSRARGVGTRLEGGGAARTRGACLAFGEGELDRVEIDIRDEQREAKAVGTAQRNARIHVEERT